MKKRMDPTPEVTPERNMLARQALLEAYGRIQFQAILYGREEDTIAAEEAWAKVEENLRKYQG
jgi:hypothetical protein